MSLADPNFGMLKYSDRLLVPNFIPILIFCHTPIVDRCHTALQTIDRWIDKWIDW